MHPNWSRLAAGLSPRTVADLRACLRRALNHAVRGNILARNPVVGTEPPRVTRPEIVPMTPEQAQAILDAVQGHRWAAIYMLALYTGMRCGELLGLRWQDVDAESRSLRVTQHLQRVLGHLSIAEPKMPQSRRTIPLADEVVLALREHRRRQLEDRLRAGDLGQDTGLVFTTQVGTPIDPRHLLRHWYGVRCAVGLPKARFHDLRHGAATLLLAQNVHPKLAQELLGHSRVSITLDLYSHTIPAQQREAIEKLAAIIGRR